MEVPFTLILSQITELGKAQTTPEVDEVISMAKKPHVLVVPFPAQGHVRPLLKLACHISAHGIKVTFVNTESVQAKLVASMTEKFIGNCNIEFATIPDSWKPEDDPGELKTRMCRFMPGNLEQLIDKLNCSDREEKISCVIADASLGWILEVGERIGINQAAFCPLSAGSLALISQIPMLLEAGRIDMNGSITKSDDEKSISLSPDVPAWKSNELTWCFPGSLLIQKNLLDICSSIQKTVEKEKWVICNTSYELESAASDLIPKLLPVGPLIASDGSADAADTGTGSFWPEDTSCLTWLDKQRAGSVIYAAFGSVAVVSQHQFSELALGLELSGQPFLWVVRPNLADGATADYPDGFLERVAETGKIIEWAPQEAVLAHPSVACFISHCGWNSTLEGLNSAVPFLCWPSFGDQFHNQSYICDTWNTGLKLDTNENGVRSRHEIQTKIQLLLSDDTSKENAEKLRKLARESVCTGGSSWKNFERFLDYLKR